MKHKCKPVLRFGACHRHLPEMLCSSNCALHFLCYFWIKPQYKLQYQNHSHLGLELLQAPVTDMILWARSFEFQRAEASCDAQDDISILHLCMVKHTMLRSAVQLYFPYHEVGWGWFVQCPQAAQYQMKTKHFL